MNLNVELLIEKFPEGVLAFLPPLCKVLELHHQEVPKELVRRFCLEGQPFEYVDRFGYDKLCKMSKSLLAPEVLVTGSASFITMSHHLFFLH